MESIANWLWQGSALALVATAILRSSPRISATARYRLWWITLAILLALPAAPALWNRFGSADGVQSAVDATPNPLAITVAIPALPWWPIVAAAVCWGLWVLVWSTRAVLGVVHLRRAKRASRIFPADREGRLVSWSALRGHGRRARLALSDDVRSAAVLGLGSPAIVVSSAVVDALTDDELDRILVHEWAHVQRRDDVAQLVQVVVRAIAGLHPAVWWIDRQLHLEREAACDDWAVNLTGSAKGYAACLTKLASLSPPTADSALLPAAFSSSDLTRRVVRLLDARRSRSTGQRAAVMALMAPTLLATALSVASVELVVTAEPAARLQSVPEPPSAPIPANVPAQADRAPAPSPRAPMSPTPQTRSQERPLATPMPPVVETPATTPKGMPVADPQVPFIPVVQPPSLPGTSTPLPVGLAAAPPTTKPPAPAARDSGITPWGAAAEAGVSVGRGSQKAAVSTAGLFSKLGKSIARSF